MIGPRASCYGNPSVTVYRTKVHAEVYEAMTPRQSLRNPHNRQTGFAEQFA